MFLKFIYVIMYKKDARTKKNIGTQYGVQISLTKEYIMGRIFSKSKLLQYVISFLIPIGLYRYVEKPLWIVQPPTTNKRKLTQMWPIGFVLIIFLSLTQLSILKQVTTYIQQTETCIWESYTNLPGTEFKCD